MGYNDFHKGFVDRNNVQKPNVVMKKKFGVRSVEEIIQSRYNYMKRDDKMPEKNIVKERTGIDYQQNIKAQRNLHNLDK